MKSSLILLCGISATAHASVANIFDTINTVNSIHHRQLANHSSSVDPGPDSNHCVGTGELAKRPLLLIVIAVL
jgi:hypothetical protein